MRSSLLQRLALFFLLLAIVPLLLAGGVITYRTFDHEKADAFTMQREKALEVSQQVEQFIQNQLERVLSLSTILSYHLDEPETQEQYMLLLETSDYNDLALTDSRGNEFIRLSRYMAITEADLMNISDQEAFTFPRESGQAYFSPVQHHRITREPLMTISVPVTDPASGSFQGVLRAQIRLRKIWTHFETYQGKEQQLIYLVDGNGHIIAHPNASIVLMGTKSVLTEHTGLAKSYHGETVLHACRDIEVGDQTFTVTVETPERVALANAYDTLRVLIFTFMASLFISALLLVSSRRRIIRPLRHLLSAVERMKEGALSQNIQVTSRDEVGVLAQSFNEMAAQLSTELEERKKAEEALRESEERYRVLFNSGNDAVFVHGYHDNGMPTNFIEVNEIACKRLGYSREELLSLAPQNIDAPEMLEKMPQTMEKIHDKKHVIFDMLHVARDGTRIPVEISAQEFMLNGRPHMLSIARDITERKEAEQALMRSYDAFSTVLDSLDVIVYVADMETYEILFLNHYAKTLFGDATGKICWKNMQAGQNGPCEFCSNRYLLDESGKPTGVYRWELCNTRNGRWYELRDRAIKWIDGRTVRVEVGSDITDRKKAEEQLRSSLEEKEILLREIHHRVKNNMQIITSMLKLQSRSIQDERLVEIFRESQSRIQSMALVHEKLYQSGDFVRINVRDYLTSLSRNISRAFASSRTKIELSVEAADISMGLDDLIPCGLIINELVSNAFKHAFPSSGTGQISVRLSRDEADDIALSVSDNGVGLPEGLDMERSDSLGLQIVNILVKQLNGTVSMVSGMGTEFKVTIPKSSRMDENI